MRVEVKAFPNEKNPKGYFGNMGEATSQALASIIGLNCNLTFSAYCGYWQKTQTPYLRRLAPLPNFIMSIPRLITGKGIDKNHCLNAWNHRT
jgi:hypothetical protein